jgi:hypothetical protein
MSLIESSVSAPRSGSLAPIRYLLALEHERGRWTCEQTGYFSINASSHLIETLDVACSGIVPSPAADVVELTDPLSQAAAELTP